MKNLENNSRFNLPETGDSDEAAQKLNASELGRLSNALRAIASEVPGRGSVRQAMAFIIVAHANAMGSAITLTDLKEMAGDDATGVALMGPATARTLDTFLEPTKREPDALGWIAQVPDEDDRRRKFLVLTEVGTAVAQRFAAAFAREVA